MSGFYCFVDERGLVIIFIKDRERINYWNRTNSNCLYKHVAMTMDIGLRVDSLPFLEMLVDLIFAVVIAIAAVFESLSHATVLLERRT